MVYQTLLADLWIAIAQVMVALALGVLSVYTGVGLLDRLTERIDEWKEIRRGNAAVGILVLTIVFSIIWMVAPRIKEVVGILDGEGTWRRNGGYTAYFIFGRTAAFGDYTGGGDFCGGSGDTFIRLHDDGYR